QSRAHPPNSTLFPYTTLFRSELRNALENPVFRPEEKRKVLEQILPRVTPTAEVRRFILLLLDRRRLVLLPAIARAYRDLAVAHRSEEHTSELQSQSNLVCRLL